MALLEKVRLLPCGPYALLAQSGLEQWVSTPRVGSSNLSKGASDIIREIESIIVSMLVVRARHRK